MADTDETEKTEEPSQRKLEEAHKKGDVAKSQEVTMWFALLAMTMIVLLFSGNMASSTARVLKIFLGNAQGYSMDGFAILSLLVTLGQKVAVVLLIPMGVLILAALAGNLVQHKPVFTTERMKPKFEKISPLAGAKRLFSPTSLVNFLKGIIKLIIVSAVMFMVVWPDRARFIDVISFDPAMLLPFVRHYAIKLLLAALAVMTIIAGLDFLFQRFTWLKKQRMTMKELRDEHKQMEGDPAIKSKLKQIRMERSRKRMMAQVPQATVVITNPTHYAVALKYEPGMAAPLCLAKGADNVALKIRELAGEHHIPIVENKPLARALHASVEVDEEVPEEHYKAVAEVISYVMRLEGKLGVRRNT